MEQDPTSKHLISRRNFIGGLGITGLLLAAGATSETPSENNQQINSANESSSAEVHNPSPVTEFPTWYKQFVDPAQSIITSTKQELAASAIGLLAGIPLRPLGIKTGNGGLTEMLDDPEKVAKIGSVSKFALFITVKAPVKEEFLFRLAPSAIINTGARLVKKHGYDKSSPQLAAGVASSLAFAHVHNKKATEKFLPLPQFLGGMVSWRLNRKAGSTHAVGAHMLHNTLPALILLPKVRTKLREFKDTQKSRKQATRPSQD